MYDLISAKLLYAAAEKMDLRPKWLTDYGLFSVEYQKKQFYFFYSTCYLNDELSSYLAKNKHVTRTILEQYNLPNIPYCLPHSKEDAVAFLSLHKKIIVKPTLGKHSQQITLVTSSEQINTIDLKTSLLEKYIEGEEYRVLVLKNKPIAFHKKFYTTPINDPEKVKRISYPKEQWNKEMIDLALRSMKALRLQFGCVDFIRDKEGRVFILEINSAPGLLRFEHPDQGPKIKIATMFLRENLNKLLSL